MADKIMVSIHCITYNQSKYICQCLDGFVMQKTNFNYEVLIHDDCSTDGTKEIVEEYAKKYPNIIKPFFEEENQYSKGRLIDVIRKLYNNCKGTYVALCEGDDYWTDPYKLQKQVDFLESHPEYSACFHPVKVIWENGEHPESIYPTDSMMHDKKVITLEDLLIQNYIQTNSIVYRWRFKDKDIKQYLPDGILPADNYLHLLHAQVGDIAYLPDIMAVYRRHENGIWCDNPRLKYGIENAKFHYSIYKNITNCSDKYYKESLVPAFMDIVDIYYKNQKFDELKKLKESYGDLLTEAIATKEKYLKNNNNNICGICNKYKKYKKYKRLFNITIILLIIFILTNLLSIFLIIKLNG